MIYITGDCHGDWRRFSSDNFPEGNEMTRDDYVIVCGDFGIWWDNDEERYWLKWLSEKPFTVLFVDGNHENFDRLKKYEEVELLGGKAHKIADNIYHLMRGYVFEIEGKKFFAFGGASSHDIDDGILDEKDFDTLEDFRKTWAQWDKQNKMFRVNHMTWWADEMPDAFEQERGLKNLSTFNNEVDFIVSHCCPQEVVSILSQGCYQPDSLTMYFNQIAHDVRFKKWFFGHYHDNQQIMSKFIMLYEQIIRVL